MLLLAPFTRGCQVSLALIRWRQGPGRYMQGASSGAAGQWWCWMLDRPCSMESCRSACQAVLAKHSLGSGPAHRCGQLATIQYFMSVPVATKNPPAVLSALHAVLVGPTDVFCIAGWSPRVLG